MDHRQCLPNGLHPNISLPGDDCQQHDGVPAHASGRAAKLLANLLTLFPAKTFTLGQTVGADEALEESRAGAEM